MVMVMVMMVMSSSQCHIVPNNIIILSLLYLPAPAPAPVPVPYLCFDCSEPETEDDLIVPPKKGARAPAVFHAPATVDHHQSDHENGQDNNTDNSSLNGDWSVGCAVRIREGRFTGHLGEVVRLGNGWVQVMTEHGEISKRSHELESTTTASAGNRCDVFSYTF